MAFSLHSNVHSVINLDFPFFPEVKYFLSKLLLLLVLSAHIILPGPAHTPQSDIFCLRAVIVDCSLCSYVCIGLPGPLEVYRVFIVCI